MMTIDEKRFRERIDETYPFDKTSQEKHGIADIAKGAILRLLAEEMKPQKGISQTIEEVKEEICLRYCKYPDTWDEEKEGIYLADSDICKNCPLNRL